DSQCTPQECGASLFDFSALMVASTGPVVVHQQGTSCPAGLGGTCTGVGDCDGSVCLMYDLQAKDPVPLDGLAQTQNLFAFSQSEAIAGESLNDDLDKIDDVVTVRDRTTGATLSIGTNGAPGRAVAVVNQSTFAYPALAVEGDRIAFLEPELS